MRKLFCTLVTLTAIALAGCAAREPTPMSSGRDYIPGQRAEAARLREALAERKSLRARAVVKAEVSQLDAEISQLEARLSKVEQSISAASSLGWAGMRYDEDLPASRPSGGAPCYVGPRGGTYTITARGAKNYSGC